MLDNTQLNRKTYDYHIERIEKQCRDLEEYYSQNENKRNHQHPAMKILANKELDKAKLPKTIKVALVSFDNHDDTH